MENHPSTRRRAIEQGLLRGRDTANQLLEVLVHKSKNNHNGNEEGLILPFAEDLAHEVLRSFTNTLLLLDLDEHNTDVFSKGLVPITIRDFSSSPKCQKPEDMDEACNSSNAKNRRGRYKRK